MRIDDHSFYNNKTFKTVNISELKDGDVFRAEIVDIKQNEMLLKVLGTNAMINAKTAKLLGLKIGELISFKVTSNNNSQLVLEPVMNQVKNIEGEIVHNMIKNFNLPENDISEELVKNLFENSLPMLKDNIVTIYNMLKDNPGLNMEKLLLMLNNNIPIKEANIENLNSFIASKSNTIKEFNNIINSLKVLKDITEFSELLFNEMTKPVSHNINFDKYTDKIRLLANIQNLEIFESQLNDLVKLVVYNTTSSNEEVLVDLLPVLNNLTDDTEKTILKNFLNKNYDKFLDLLSSKYSVSLRSNNIDNIDAIYKNLYSFTSKLSEIISNNEDKDSSLQNNISQIQNNIEFTEQLLSFDTYLSIPLRHPNLDSNPELYVLKNKKKKISGSNISAILCLDLSKLGYTEVLINKSDKRISLKFRSSNSSSNNVIAKNINELRSSLILKGFSLSNVNYEKIEEKTNLMNKDILVSDDVKDVGNTIQSFDIRI